METFCTVPTHTPVPPQPTLDELLNDPMVELMLHRDRVDRAALSMTLDRIRAHLRTARPRRHAGEFRNAAALQRTV